MRQNSTTLNMCRETKKLERLALTPDNNFNIEIRPSSLDKNKPRLLPQFLAACAISMGGFNVGTANGWSGGALTKIDEEFDVSPGHLAFVVSALIIGTLVGTLMSAKLTDVFGRRTTLLFVPSILVSGWLFIAFSSSIGYIYVGRLACGIAVGILLSTCNVYISEISSPEYRGRLGCINTLCITFGVLMMYIFAALLTWRTSCFCFIGFSLLMFLCVYLIPESPYWFLKKDRKEEAIKSIKWLRGSNYDLTEEMKEMLSKIDPEEEKSNYREIFKRRTRTPLLIAMFVQLCQQLCGANLIMMFTSLIIKNSNSSIDEQYGAMFAGVSQMVGTIVSVMIIDKAGRKPVLAISLLGVSIAMFILGIGFYMKENWPTWAPVVTILFCVFTFCLGLRSIPWIVSSEVLNTSFRSTGTSICVFFNRILTLLTTQAYPYFRDVAGDEGVFLTYGCISLILAIMTPYIVPETNKKSLEEIQEYFERRAAIDKTPKVTSPVNEQLV